METIGADGTVQIRVAGIASFIVMKSIALVERAKPKDAYDIHFCLENYPDGLMLLAEQFAPLLEQEAVRDALRELARQFCDEEAAGLRLVADVEEVIGKARAIRKLAVASRVREFLGFLEIAT
jgi:predicted nucleotidyltransferase